MLSKEIGTSLRGQSIQFEIMALSLPEYLSFKNIDTEDTYSTRNKALIRNGLKEFLINKLYNDLKSRGFRILRTLILFKILLKASKSFFRFFDLPELIEKLRSYPKTLTIKQHDNYMNKDEIIAFLASNKQELKDKFGVTSIGLFGTYARDEAKIDSDIDISVEIESTNKFRSFFGLKRHLEQKFHNKVDLGIESSLKPIAKKYIQQEIIYV